MFPKQTSTTFESRALLMPCPRGVRPRASAHLSTTLPGHGYISRVVYISRTCYLPYVINNSVPRRARLIIEIRLDEMLAAQGRTFYWLAKQTGISHTTLWRLKKAKAFGMNLDTLEKMCRVLKCQPGDILTLTTDKKNSRNGGARKRPKS